MRELALYSLEFFGPGMFGRSPTAFVIVSRALPSNLPAALIEIYCGRITYIFATAVNWVDFPKLLALGNNRTVGTVAAIHWGEDPDFHVLRSPKGYRRVNIRLLRHCQS
jgi:hypothetical protein